MKKVLERMLAVLLIMPLVACGSGSKTTEAAVSSKEESVVETAEEQIPEEKEETAAEEEIKQEEAPVQEVSFESFTPIDNEECSVTIKELDPDNIWGYTIKTVLENKSSEKTYMFSVTAASVNGVDADPFFAAEVAPGKKSNEEITLTATSLKENGITEFTDIEIVYRVYDSNDWMADSVAEETFHIYPYGEDKATIFTREIQSSDQVLVDNENVTVLITDKVDDPIWGYTLNMFIVNKTDTEIMISVDEASVNGFMADPFFAKSVQPGKSAFTSMSWSDTTLEENEITEIENIEFTLRVYDSNDIFSGDFFNGTVTVTP